MRQSIILLLILGVSLTDQVLGQATFEKIFRINNHTTEVYSTFPLSDGYVLLSQHGKGIINLTKLDKDGNFVSGNDVFDSRSGFVMSSSMTPNGDFLITGVANEEDDNETSKQTGFFLRVSSSLSLSTAYNFEPFAGNGDTWASGAIMTSDGSILILVKSTVTSVGGVDNYFEVIKLNSNANEVIWQSAILTGSDNTVFDITETSAGYEIYGAVKHQDTNWNLYLGTISKDGTEMKRQLLVGGGDWDGAFDFQEDVKRKVYNRASSIVKVNDNTLAVAAYTRSFGSNSSIAGDKDGKTILLLCYPVTGNSYNWTAILDGQENEMLLGPYGKGNFISLSNGDLLLSGYTNSTGNSSPYPGGFMYRFAAGSDGTITPRWQHIFTPPNNMTPFGLAEANDGTIFLTGTSDASTKEGVIIQTTAEGVNPVGCISANQGTLTLQSTSPSVMSTTNMALLDATLNLAYAPNDQRLSNTTTITTICSANTSDEANIPSIGREPQSQTIASGQTVTLSVLATGTPPIHYQWYQGESGTETDPIGLDSASFTSPALTSTTKFWVKISNDGGEIFSATATISVEDVKWHQSDWPDYKQVPFNLALGKNGTVLATFHDVITQFGINDWPCSSPPGHLTALDQEDGSILWDIDVGHSAPPAVSESGAVYTNIENNLYRINPENGMKSLIYTADYNFTSSPAVAADGTIFIGAGQRVLAINPESGTLIWEEPTDKFVINHPTIGADGIVYVIPWILSSRIYAFYPFKSMDQVKWTHDIQGFFSTPPVVGEGGTIYAGARHVLYAINPESGTIKWHFTTPIAPAGYPTIHMLTSEPVVGNNGTIYFSTPTLDDTGGALYAIHPEGYPKWFFQSGLTAYTSPVLAKDETIYYTADKLYVLDLYGQELWSNETAGRIGPVISNDGTIYAGSTKDPGIQALAGTSGGLMTAHWPCYGHDFQNTSQHDDIIVGIPPTITVQPENQLIMAGETATFSITATGDPEISYQWYKGVLGDKSNPVGENAPSYTTPPLSSMTNYWVEVDNEFGKDMSITVMASTGNIGEVKWFYNTNPDWNREEDGEVMGGIALANDGTLYFGVMDARLYAMNPDGTVKWITKVQAHLDEYSLTNAIVWAEPTIGEDGTIYITTLGYYNGSSGSQNFGFLWAINPDGSEKWRYEAGNTIAGLGSSAPWIRSSAAIGHEGTIYTASEDGVLHALNPDGSLKWKFISYEEKGWLRGLGGNAPTVGLDGTIYYVAAGEIELNDQDTREISLFALTPGGTLKWEFKFEGKVYYSAYPPSIGPDGKIYIDCKIYINDIGDNADYLHAINPDGTEAWKFHCGENIGSSVVIGADNTIYFAGSSYVSPSSRLKLYALNPDGTEKWRFPREGDPEKIGFRISAPVIGADNNIYFGIPGDGKLYALRPDGTQLWNNPPYLGSIINSPPVIAPDGTLYTGLGLGSESVINGYIYAVSTNAFGVANTAWPMAGHDPKRSSRIAGSPIIETPVIVVQPKDSTIYEGQAVKITVGATGSGLKYQWYEGTDRSKPVGTSKSFVTPDLNETTTYWVQVSNTIGFVNSRYVTVTVSATGIEVIDMEGFEVLIYPNPASSVITLQVAESKRRDAYMRPNMRYTFELYDLNGRKLLEKHIPAGTESFDINVSSLESGIYFLRLNTDKFSTTRKLIIRQ